MTLFYVDVSHYDWDRNNGNLDWHQMHDAGITIMNARASYGDPAIYSPETRHFKEMATAAQSAGFFTGGYHNLIRGDSASIARQVDYFRKELDSAKADWAMLDIEPYAALQNLQLWPRIVDADAFASRWAKLEPNRKLTFYIARWVWEQWLGRQSMVNIPGALISARYAMGTKQGTPQELYSQSGGDNGTGWQPYGGVVPRVWQFASTAIVPGKNGATDVNAFKGTESEFRDMVLTPKAPEPLPATPSLPAVKNGSRELSLKNPHMRGSDVLFVQKFIGVNKTGATDGDFGAKTKAGVQWYQGMQGLKADGVVGTKTWAKLLAPAKSTPRKAK